MSLGLYERRARARRRFWWGVVKWGLGLGIVIVAGVQAYVSASALAEHEVTLLKQEIAGLSEDIDRLQQSNADQRMEIAAARRQLSGWQERYAQDVPSGPMKDLLELAQQKRESGVEPDRLAFLIRSAEPESSCANEPETKRFIVRTPLYDGANDAVSFADGRLIITARGESAVDPGGNPEARFDPAQPVRVRFAGLGGKVSEATGVLPLQHSVVAGDSEYRFNIVAGEPGFLRVTGDRCLYP